MDVHFILLSMEFLTAYCGNSQQNLEIGMMKFDFVDNGAKYMDDLTEKLISCMGGTISNCVAVPHAIIQDHQGNPWHCRTTGKSCYHFATQRLLNAKYAADGFCLAIQAHTLAIDDIAEHQDLILLIERDYMPMKNEFGNPVYWIDLENHNGTWIQKHSGERVHYVDWDQHEAPVGSCARIARQIGWSMAANCCDCNTKVNYGKSVVCEIDI